MTSSIDTPESPILGLEPSGVAALRAVPLFEGLAADELSLLAMRCSQVRLEAGARVFREGDAADGLYVVESGAVSIVREAVGQPVQRIARLGPGGFFGEMGLLDDGMRSSTAVVSEAARLLHVRKEHLLALLKERPLLAVKLRIAIIRRHGHNVASAVQLSGRREIRTRVDTAVRLEVAGDRTLSARLENLSPGGACFRGLPASWSPGLAVRFRLSLPEGEQLLDLDGMVAWRQGDACGVAFRGSGPTDEEQVRRALRRLLEAGE